VSHRRPNERSACEVARAWGRGGSSAVRRGASQGLACGMRAATRGRKGRCRKVSKPVSIYNASTQ
jgi:hypothetical protein